GYIGDSQRGATLDQVKKALMQYGVLSISVAAGGRDWSEGGEMQDCGNSGQNHMVNIVGWNEKDELIIANSWGESWGDKGFGYAPLGCDELGSGAGSVGFLVLPGGPVPHVRLPESVDVRRG